MDNPKVIKKGDQVITNYVDEKTGKFTSYEVGIKLEVSDFSGQWFPAKIVEVDKGEKEVLVHFENWSARFDEWIKMDSNRLRPGPNTNIVKTHFKIGEHVEALWNPGGQRYPGVIHNILPNDCYQVLFDDGIKLKKKYNQIFKLKPVTRKSGGGPSGGSSKKGHLDSSDSANMVLPELTPVPGSSSDPAAKSSVLQPPPLIPKPTHKRSSEGQSKVQPSEAPLPGTAAVKAPTRKRKKVVPPAVTPEPPPKPTTSSPPLLSTPDITPDVTPQTESPLSPSISDEPLSSKRKRTVQDYSALLRIRRRFPFSREGEIERVKRPRRGRSSPGTEPPELFPESVPPVPDSAAAAAKEVLADSDATTASESEQSLRITTPPASPPPSSQEPTAQSESLNSVAADQILEAALPMDEASFIALPTKPKPKPKRKFRPFNSSRRRVKKGQRIKYVTVDDEEFAAAGPGNLNKPKPALSAGTTPARVQAETSEAMGDGDSSAPSTPASAKDVSSEPGSELLQDGSMTPSPGGDSAGLKIIKRRRRRTYAHLQLIASEGIGVDTTSSPTTPSPGAPPPGDEPMSKRKRTIHDYSMLLKTRPKFFFDIDAEAERPGMRRRRFTGPSAPLGVGTVTEGSVVSDSTEIAADSEAIHDTGVEEAEAGHERPLGEIKKPDSVTVSVGIGDGGATSIATHRPVRRSSSQFARKPTVLHDEIHVLNTRGPESGLKGSSATVVLENLDVKVEPSSSAGGRRGSLNRSRGDLKVKGHALPQGDLDYKDLENEEQNLSTAGSKQVQSAAPPSSDIGVESEQPHRAKKEVRRNKRLVGNRWWKKRQSSQTVRRQPSETISELESPVATPPAPTRNRRLAQKLKRRPGDLLSGLTLNRIRTIRGNLFRQGFKKRIIAEPASKDVSVDIISCICGSADEHGLMVQCEYCQCWQHGQCFEIETVTDMPKNYVCGACLYPENVRTRKPLDFQYDFHKVGKLPRFPFGPPVEPKTAKMLQETNTLIHRLHQVRGIIQTSRVHMNIMEAKPDHPKLYQWDKPHQTIRESQQERKFNKIYRPLLRRLLYFNRDDPTYVSKLRARVEQVVKKRSAEERKKAEKRLNEKFPSIFPSPKPLPTPALQKRVGPAAPPIFKTPAVPPLLASSKEAKRLEAEALRIRKELETLNKPKVFPSPAPIAENIKEKAPEIVKVVPKVEEPDDSVSAETKEVMEEILSKVEGSAEAILAPTENEKIEGSVKAIVATPTEEDNVEGSVEAIVATRTEEDKVEAIMVPSETDKIEENVEAIVSPTEKRTVEESTEAIVDSTDKITESSLEALAEKPEAIEVDEHLSVQVSAPSVENAETFSTKDLEQSAERLSAGEEQSAETFSTKEEQSAETFSMKEQIAETVPVLPCVELPTQRLAPLAVISVTSIPKREVVDLGEEAPPEFPDLPDLDPPPLEHKSSLLAAVEPNSNTVQMSAEELVIVNSENLSALQTPKLEQDFSVDLLNLDPLDPKFSTIAADLVKSCCEEPESLIKTLQDLANDSTADDSAQAESGAEPVTELGSDNDLINFLDEALMDAATAGLPPAQAQVSSAPEFESKFMLPPPPPPVAGPSSSSFILPPPPPRLTRLTPELCRGNLILTILDQQRIIDQHLDEIEARVVEFEKMRGLDASNRAVAFHRISSLQAKVKRMLREFEVVKSIGRKAERGLREVLQEENCGLGFEEGSGSDPEETPDKDNEETESADEEEDDEEELSDELDDL